MKGKKLHLGCGNHILEEYVNVDRVLLPGVDVVHDLAILPWPFETGKFDEVVMVDVLEHLPQVTLALEEVHRITKKGARVAIRVPYYNSWDAWTDPTHVHAFNECSFDFFDLGSETGTYRSYYSSAKFQVYCVAYLVFSTGRTHILCDSWIDPHRLKIALIYDRPIIRSSLIKWIYTHLAHKFGNVIRTLHVELVRL